MPSGNELRALFLPHHQSEIRGPVCVFIEIGSRFKA